MINAFASARILLIETGFEHVNGLLGKDQIQAKFRLSNVYRREGSEWRMVHHHVDFDPRILEIVSKLQTSSSNVRSDHNLRAEDAIRVWKSQLICSRIASRRLPSRRFAFRASPAPQGSKRSAV